jgi:N-acetylneuraminic acid mutarotase
MVGRRYDHTATLLADGRVLVAGGTRSTVILDSTEIYDPTSNSWSPGPSLPSPRTGHAATLLPGGRVLVVGGNGTSDPLDTADLYDPRANRWSSTNPMGTARSTLSSILLKDGRVLAIGGVPVVSGPPIAELFNPQLETWSPAGTSTQPTFYYGAATTILKDGRVFISGGANATLMGDGLVVGYVYDPTTDRWVTTNPMVQGRVSHSASLLPDGRVLIAGGRDRQVNGRGLDTTEIFDANATVPASPATSTGMPVVSSSVAASPIQGLASRPLAAPLLVGGGVVLAIGILGTLLVRRQRVRRRRRSL